MGPKCPYVLPVSILPLGAKGLTYHCHSSLRTSRLVFLYELSFLLEHKFYRTYNTILAVTDRSRKNSTVSITLSAA